LLARHRREPFEKIIDCVARFDVIEQGLDRNSCAIEHCGAAHHLGTTVDNWLCHADKITPIPARGTGGASALCSPARLWVRGFSGGPACGRCAAYRPHAPGPGRASPATPGAAAPRACRRCCVAAPPPEPRRLAEADTEVVERFVARLRRQILRELEEAKPGEPPK